MSDQPNIRLFYASCFALITTAFSFSIRAGILSQLGVEFDLSAKELGVINSMWFLGFPIAMVIGGIFYGTIGPKRIMTFAFFAHTIGILLTIYSRGYNGLLISTLFIGLGNGCTEAACNPMIADSYSGKQMNTLLNRFHMWFPGGIVIGSLVSKFMTDYMFSWQSQIWIILIPTIIYAVLFWGQKFPVSSQQGTSALEGFKGILNSGMVKIMDLIDAKLILCLTAILALFMWNSFDGFILYAALLILGLAIFKPLYYFMMVCMAFTAISEFGPQQWTGIIMAKSGAEPMVILALVTGLMAVGRYFGGEFVHKFDQTGVLLGSAVFATIGIFLFSTQTGTMAYVAAVIFAMGVCYFWPNMIGFIAEKIPSSGALGMSILGAVGMFSTSIWQPIIGGWIDSASEKGATMGLSGDALSLAAGQDTLRTMVAFPLVLIVLFTILLFWMRNRAKTAQ